MEVQISVTKNGTIKYPLHSHNYYEIMYYLSGEGQLLTEKGNYVFSPGTIAIVPPSIMHGSSSENGFKNICVQGDFSHLLNLKETIILKDNKYNDGKSFAEMIMRNSYTKTTLLSNLVDTYINFILQQADLNAENTTAVLEIQKKIIENAFDPTIDIKKILNESKYAEDYIRMCFTKQLGISPLKFLTKIRIEHACTMIEIYKNHIPLTKIAEACGYTDYIYFSRTFKTITGKSPREYLNLI